MKIKTFFVFSVFIVFGLFALYKPSETYADSCRLEASAAKSTDETSYTLSVTVNTDSLDKGQLYHVRVDDNKNGVGGDTISQNFDPANVENDTYTTGFYLDSGYKGKTYSVYVQRAGCFELAGTSCAVQNCTTSVYFDPKAPVEKPGTGFPEAPSQSFSFNQVEDKALPGFIFSGSKNATLGSIVTAAIPYIFTIAGILLLLYLLYGGLHLMTSGGDPKAIGEAKGKITNALVGFIIIFVAYWLVQIIGRVLGLEGITDIFG